MPFTFTLPPSIRLAIFTAKLVATAHLFNQWIGHPSLTDGPSMLPTLNVRDDYVWINCLYRRGKGIKLGDVVSLRHPLVPGDRACKRVVAMEGDFVGTGSPASGDRLMIQVPQGHAWVAGDNVDWSRDSRDWGPVPMALIVGKVEARFWPLGQAKWMTSAFRDVQDS